MAWGHRLNTSVVLAAVHGLSGLFRTVSAVAPSLCRPPSHSVPVPNRPSRLRGRKATWKKGPCLLVRRRPSCTDCHRDRGNVQCLSERDPQTQSTGDQGKGPANPVDWWSRKGTRKPNWLVIKERDPQIQSTGDQGKGPANPVDWWSRKGTRKPDRLVIKERDPQTQSTGDQGKGPANPIDWWSRKGTRKPNRLVIKERDPQTQSTGGQGKGPANPIDWWSANPIYWWSRKGARRPNWLVIKERRWRLRISIWAWAILDDGLDWSASADSLFEKGDQRMHFKNKQFTVCPPSPLSLLECTVSFNSLLESIVSVTFMSLGVHCQCHP